MKKLRWAMDGEFWDLDLSTPATLDGVARPVADGGDGLLLPLGLSRGSRLSRPKQIDFLQRFMAAPLVPSFSDGVGLSLQRLLSLPLPSFARDVWLVLLSPLILAFHIRVFLLRSIDFVYQFCYVAGAVQCAEVRSFSPP